MLTKPSLGQRLGLMGLAAALSLTFLTAPSAAEASQGENAAAPDPTARGCVSGSYRVTYWNMINKKHNNQLQGRMDLMYSPSCGTNWVNIYGTVAGTPTRQLSRTGQAHTATPTSAASAANTVSRSPHAETHASPSATPSTTPHRARSKATAATHTAEQEPRAGVLALRRRPHRFC